MTPDPTEEKVMRINVDPDEYETVSSHTPCAVCGGNPRLCDGGCNGSSIYRQRRRTPEEIARIKAERRKVEEDAILAQADAVRQRRLTQ